MNELNGSLIIDRETGLKNILLIDDEEIILELITEVLKYGGFNAFAYSDVTEGIKFYEENWQQIDLVLLDMIMPKMNGIDVFTKLKAINSKIKAIILSGYSEERQVDAFLQTGIKTFLKKPVNISDLSDAIVTALNS